MRNGTVLLVNHYMRKWRKRRRGWRVACDVDGAGSKREMTRGGRRGRREEGKARENRKPLAAQ